MHFQMPDENIEDIQRELTETVLTKKLKYIAFNLFLKEILCIFLKNLKNKHKQIIICWSLHSVIIQIKKSLESIIIIYQNYNFSIYYIFREKRLNNSLSHREFRYEKSSLVYIA